VCNPLQSSTRHRVLYPESTYCTGRHPHRECKVSLLARSFDHPGPSVPSFPQMTFAGFIGVVTTFVHLCCRCYFVLFPKGGAAQPSPFFGDGVHATEFATKCFPVLALALLAWGDGLGGNNAYRARMFAGFCFSVLGDALLLFDERDQEAGVWFIAGLVAFLFGHLCYIFALARGLDAADVIAPLPAILAVPCVLYGCTMYTFILPGLQVSNRPQESNPDRTSMVCSMVCSTAAVWWVGVGRVVG
jgi:hypothetical protein